MTIDVVEMSYWWLLDSLESDVVDEEKVTFSPILHNEYESVHGNK